MRPLIRPLQRSFGGTRAVAAGACAALLAAGVLAVALPAAAATCIFDGPTATVTVQVGDGEPAVIGRSGDAITLDGAPCDVATVTNTDAIVVNGTGVPAVISIDLVGGDFAPGLTVESDGSSEIEFTINLPAGSPTVRVAGGGGTDNVVVGAAGINLNATESAGDADVVVSGLASIVVEGNGGADVLSVAGGAGTGGSAAASLNGGGEDDQLLGGLGGSTFTGGDGADTVNYAAAAGIAADLGAGVVTHSGGQADQLSGIENLVGSPADDVLFGDLAANTIAGAEGDDRIEGRGGDDNLQGGAGIDTLGFGPVDVGVEVDLLAGTASGEGEDTVAGFENVMGTKRADTIQGDDGPNKLAGGAGSDELTGRDGTDNLRGGPGNDQMFGENGDDRVLGLAGRDQLDGGQGRDVCKGGPDPDSFVFCENIRLG